MKTRLTIKKYTIIFYLRTRGTTKTKMTLSTKQVFGVFCFQEQKTVLENTKQTAHSVFKEHFLVVFTYFFRVI